MAIIQAAFCSGTAFFTIKDIEVKYEGLLDDEGKAFGEGKATFLKDPGWTWTGTFKCNKPHGLGES